jgi:hypothetical protein
VLAANPLPIRLRRPGAATPSSCTVNARFGALPRLHGHGRTVSLTTIFDEHDPTLCDMASRADERMVLDTTHSDRVVRDHATQDQLGATGTTTHYSCSLMVAFPLSRM